MEIKFRIETDYKYFIASDVVIKHVLTLLHVDSDAQTYKTEKDKSICHQFCYPKLAKNILDFGLSKTLHHSRNYTIDLSVPEILIRSDCTNDQTLPNK
jgi:hypothetical protein